MLDLVENPESWFSYENAQVSFIASYVLINGTLFCCSSQVGLSIKIPYNLEYPALKDCLIRVVGLNDYSH